MVDMLQLEPHVEGGYFRQTYKGTVSHNNRSTMTIIYYLQTEDAPLTQWVRNKSDLICLHHQGGRQRIFMIRAEDRQLEEAVISKHVLEGELSHLIIPANTWNASLLEEEAYALRSEAVAPGF